MTDDLPDHTSYSLIKATDESGNVVTVLVDASGAMFAVMKGEYSGALQTVKLDAEHRIIARTLGSIDDTLEERWTTIDADANHVYNFPAVPTGKLWHVMGINACDFTRSLSYVNFYKMVGPAYYYLHYDSSPSQGYFSIWQNDVWLKAGQNIRILFAGSQSGDDLEAQLLGVEIDAE